MPQIIGVTETALYVHDLERARTFYQLVFNFPEILREEGRLIALGIRSGQVLLLFAKDESYAGSGPIPGHGSQPGAHLAFGIDAAQLPDWRAWLQAHQIAIESDSACGGTGHSLYFRDPDENLLELVTPGCWKVF